MAEECVWQEARQMAACLTQQCLLKLWCPWWLSSNSIYPVPSPLRVVLPHHLKLPSVKVQEGHFCCDSPAAAALCRSFPEKAAHSPFNLNIYIHCCLVLILLTRQDTEIFQFENYYSDWNKKRQLFLNSFQVLEIINVRYQINILQWGYMLLSNCSPC